MFKKARKIGFLSIIAFCAVFLVIAGLNSDTIISVKVTLNKGVKEVKDHSLLGIGKAHAKPDYRLKIRMDRKMIDCGTMLNTSAVDGITFPVKAMVPIKKASEILLIEDDKLENDLLERVLIDGTIIDGQKYRFEIETDYRFETGLQWFFLETAVGKAIAFGITIGVVIVIVTSLAI